MSEQEVGGPGTDVEKRDDGKRSSLSGVKNLNNFRADLMRFHAQFVSLLGGEMEANVFIETVTTAFITTPKLAECDPKTMMLAVRRSAQLKLRADGVEGAFIPRGKEATFMPMFQGIVRKMLRAGTVKKVEARVVHYGDEFTYHYGLNPDLRHIPCSFADRGGTMAAYAVVYLTNGDVQFEVMDIEELESIRRKSKENNRGKEGPAWTSHPDEMRRKIVLKRLSKYIEQDAEMAAVIAYDHAYDEGRVVDPRDMLPETEDRSLDERVTDHANRQTSDLRQAMESNGNSGPEVVQGIPVEDEASGSEGGEPSILDAVNAGKKFPEKTWRELIHGTNEERGYVTHWAVTGKSGDMLTDDEKLELHDYAAERKARAEAEASDGAGSSSESDEPVAEGDDSGDGEETPPPPVDWGVDPNAK